MSASVNGMSELDAAGDRPDDPQPGGAAEPAPPAATVEEPNGRRWLPLALAVIAADQLVKALVVSRLVPYRPVHLLPVLDFTLMYNPGAAFSFLADATGWQRWLFVGLAAVVGVGIVIWLGYVKARSQRMLACGLSLILGGALGNVIDRLRMGHVVDFISAHWNQHAFPAFNVADSAITIGAALLVLDMLRESRRGRAGEQ